jgi:hypothetical protein
MLGYYGGACLWGWIRYNGTYSKAGWGGRWGWAVKP